MSKGLRIVLVAPMHASNVGSVARVCGNFGVNDVRIVAPRCDVLCEDARMLATHHARGILEGFSVCASLREAVGEAERIVGFSRRMGDMRRPDLGWSDLPELRTQPGLTSLVFGPEDTGLSHDDLSLCTHLCTLPTHPTIPSMNLSQAVAVVLAGVVWQGGSEIPEKPAVSTRFESERPISAQSLLSLVDHWKQVMVDVELTRDGNPERLLHYFHRILNRAQITEREGSMLRGFFSQIQIQLGTRKTKKESSDVAGT